MKKRSKKINKKFLVISLSIIILLIIIISAFIIYQEKEKPQGIMILIEYKNTPGLMNMVSQMKEKNIYGLLMVSPEYVKENQLEIKKILSQGNIEIVASNIQGPLWNIPYDEQKRRIIEMLDEIENVTGIRPRAISSTYMASDKTTIDVAEELKIEYVLARGTTDTKATIYQPENYSVKILSVSNIPLVTFKYGSLCDYSFYERAGSPETMLEELNRAIEPLTQKEIERFGKNHKITFVSHANIGGYLKPWNNMWNKLWNNQKINWVNLDEFTKTEDWKIPLWQIPINQNNPYTEDRIRPLVEYENEEKVNYQNICGI